MDFPVAPPITAQPPAVVERKVRWAHAAYVFQTLAWLAGGGGLIGAIIAGLNRGAVRGTWLESHFQWQISTFWRGLGYGILAAIGAGLASLLLPEPAERPAALLVGAVYLGWYVGRVAKGWLALHHREPIDVDD
ncbi:MAG TPA: hypothetical protein VF746_11245 [Longimicrobium sp.]|jgi:uncharacterized membrane protein